VQLETVITLNPDGSGRITERLNFSRWLLNMADNAGADLKLEPLLAREAVLARMQEMGQGIKLVTHEVRQGPQLSREAVSVFEIPDLANFTYIFPFVPQEPKSRLPGLKTSITPFMGSVSGWSKAGRVHVNFTPQWSEGAVAATNMLPRRPLSVQPLCELRPVFQDLLSALQVKIVFESYAPIEEAFNSDSYWRDSNVQTRRVDLIDFAPGTNLDTAGFPLLENEEVMLDLLRGDLRSSWVQAVTKEWHWNKTLPAIHGGGAIAFRPSQEYFKKFFEGKTLAYPGRDNFPAKWEEVGWTPTGK